MKFRSIFGAFLFITLASFVAFFFFIQTKSFGNLISKVVSDLSQRRLNARVSVKNVEISLFPPGLELNKVTVSKTSADEKLRAEFGKLGFYINLIEVEERRLSFGEIRIQDSVVEYDHPPSEEDTTEIEQKVIDKIFNLSERAPVRVDTVIIENAHLHVNHDLLEARRLKVFKKGREFIVRFHVANLKPSAGSDLVIDEIWGDLEIGRKNLEIYRLKLLHDVQTVLVKGRVDNYRLLKKSTAHLKGEGHLHLKDLDQVIGISRTIRMHSGFANVTFDLNYAREELQGRSAVGIRDFTSNLIYADKLDGDIRILPGSIEITRAELIRGDERARFLAPVSVFDIGKKQILPAPISLEVTDFTLTNALRLEESLEPLKGKLTGKLTVRHDRGDFYFKPQDGFLMSDVALVVGKEKPSRIIHIKSARLKEADLAIVDGEVRISTFAQLPRSSLEVDGFVNKKTIRFSIVDADVNLEDLGNVADLDIKGSGPLSVDVTGGGKDVQINLRGRMKGFEVLGYQLGLADTNITVDLGDDNVIIHKLESKFETTPISVTGAINYDSLDIALGVNSPSTNYHELSRILTPIFSKMDFLPPDLGFNAKVDANVFGKTRMKDLKVRSSIAFTDLTGYGETINSGSMSIGLLDEVVTFRNFEGQKGRGQVTGNFSFIMPRDHLAADFAWENIDLSSFNFSKLLRLNVDGKIAGTLKGEGHTKDYDLHLKSRLFDTRTQGHRFEDSLVDMHIFPDRLKGNFNFLGTMLAATFDYSLERKGASSLKVKAAVPQVRPILVALLGQHIDSEPIEGRMFFDLDTSFVGEFKEMDLTGHLRELSFNHPEFNFNYKSDTPDFLIRDNVIRKWALDLRQPDIYLKASGSGTFGSQVRLDQEVQFSSKLIEILFSQVLSSEGFIRTSARVNGAGDKYTLALKSSAERLNMSIQGVPFPVNDLRYNLEYSERRLQISEIRTSLENGFVAMRGDVFFDDDAPDVNVKYVLDRAEIPVLGKSAINVSGEGIILGNEFPYNLTGDLVLNKAQIVNELSEFSNKSTAFSQVRFLPRNQESVLGKLVNLNVNVKADTPVRINNSLMDVSLRGELRLTGSPSRPRGDGRLYAPVNTSRVFFKNNEYFITSADINFFAKKELTNPDFDIQAMTTMSTYKVYAKAYGDLERFNFDLTSDPALPRNSILSLIAFGYTDEIGALRPEDQQSLTQMGVGSFVLDRFKISDILNKQFGVQVNVGAVFEQSEQSLLAGRSQDTGNTGPGDVGRTRSATKIELKKRLDEALSLSVSSTMGGYIGSRQSMNLTYSVNRKVQLEGVYELRTAAEGEEDTINNSNSIGGDVKFRWSFK